MAMSNANLERRVQRNTNDIEAIYDTLTDHGEHLADITAKLGQHDTRFDAIDDTLTEVLRRLPDPAGD